MSLEINFYSSGQIEATLYILPDESTFLFKNPTESSFKILLWIYEKIATSSAHENADARARENLKRLYIQVTFVYINYNEFSRFLTSSLGIKHDECIIRPAAFFQSTPSSEVPVATLSESPPLYNTVRLIHQ